MTLRDFLKAQKVDIEKMLDTETGRRDGHDCTVAVTMNSDVGLEVEILFPPLEWRTPA